MAFKRALSGSDTVFHTRQSESVCARDGASKNRLSRIGRRRRIRIA
jgi:hypothetical protein